MTTKSSDSDYFLSDMIFTKNQYNEGFVRSSMSVSGIFSDDNQDADELATPPMIHAGFRREIAEEFQRAGETFYRYNIIANINHGLSRQNIPLPSGVPIQLVFKRAEATKALLQISNKNADNSLFTYPDKVVTLMSPTLSCYFVESVKADEFYSKTKMYDQAISFLDYSIRKELLLDNVDNFLIKLFEGEHKTY